MKIFFTLIIMCISFTPSYAADLDSLTKLVLLYEKLGPRKTPCWLARRGIAFAGGIEAASSMALSRGHSEADIRYMIRKCGLS